jgi:hypothetical protein
MWGSFLFVALANNCPKSLDFGQYRKSKKLRFMLMEL